MGLNFIRITFYMTIFHFRLKQKSIISSVICLILFLASTLALGDENNSIRIAPPLDTLIKQFKRDPKAEAEVILRSTKVTIDNNYRSQTNSYVAIYINSDEAVRDYSQISISFNSFYEDISLEFAKVRTPEGQMESIKADATQIQSPTDENFYHDQKELLFSLPNVRKGSIIEFQYRFTDTKKIIDNQWFDSFNLHWWEDRAAGQGSRADSVYASEFSITAPKNMMFYHNDLMMFGLEKSRYEKDNLQVISWKGKKLAKVTLQESMPRHLTRSAHLRISTIESWQQIAEWANKLSEPHIATSANIDALVTEISKKTITHTEKVKAVYQAVQERVRYVFAHVGRGGYEPHNAFEVLTNGYGDCKDQTILAVTLLRKLNIKADPALVVTRSRGIPDMSITGVSFDHMIVHIPAQADLPELWMDTTGDKSLYPGFSSGLEGQPALIVNPNTQKIITIPTLKSEDHFAFFELVFDKPNGKNSTARFTLTFGGQYEQRLRSMWKFSRERDKAFREMIGHIYPSAEMTSLTAYNADNLWQPFYMTGNMSFKNIWNGENDTLRYGFNISQLLNLFVDLRDLYKPQDRLQEFAVDPGYSISSRIVFTRPSSEHIPIVVSQGQHFDNSFFTLTQNGNEVDNNYVVEQKLLMKSNRISLKDYPQFYQLTRQLYSTSDWLINYRYDNSAAELATLTQAANNSKKASDAIALAKLHIKKGEYQKALDTANKAIKLEPENGEAHYILGLAQGYNNQLYESEKSFVKAEELGFKI